MSRGDFFLHEHPANATSWGLEEIKELQRCRGVIRAVADQCEYGQWSRDQSGPGLVKKTIGFLINSWCIARRLSRRCRGGHRHIRLWQGRAKSAEVYPPELCREIVTGLFEEIRAQRRTFAQKGEGAYKRRAESMKEAAIRGEALQSIDLCLSLIHI